MISMNYLLIHIIHLLIIYHILYLNIFLYDKQDSIYLIEINIQFYFKMYF